MSSWRVAGLVLLMSCSAQQIEDSLATVSDALVVAGGAAAGTAVGGPGGGAAGAAIAYQSLEVAEHRTGKAELEGKLDDQQKQHAIDVEAARSLGYQQGADNAAAMVALLKNDPELAQFFQEKAAESAAPLRARLDQVRAEALTEAARQAAKRWWWTIALIVALVALYVAKQIWWTKKQDKRYLTRMETTSRQDL